MLALPRFFLEIVLLALECLQVSRWKCLIPGQTSPLLLCRLLGALSLLVPRKWLVFRCAALSYRPAGDGNRLHAWRWVGLRIHPWCLDFEGAIAPGERSHIWVSRSKWTLESITLLHNVPPCGRIRFPAIAVLRRFVGVFSVVVICSGSQGASEPDHWENES